MLIGFILFTAVMLAAGYLVWIGLLMLQWDDTSKWCLVPLVLAVLLIFMCSGFWSEVVGFIGGRYPIFSL